MDETRKLPEFVGFPKIARLSREVIVSEKIDGTNAIIHVCEDGDVMAGSRTRWLNDATGDNAGFLAWVRANTDELRGLGPGTHFGEWWGSGIQRGYGLPKGQKRFSLFNVVRWSDDYLDSRDPAAPKRPACCGVVPILYRGVFNTAEIDGALSVLRSFGSRAVPGFMNPEGVVVYHTQGRVLFKKTLEKDEEYKSKRAA